MKQYAILGILMIVPGVAFAQKCPTNPYIKSGEACPPAATAPSSEVPRLVGPETQPLPEQRSTLADPQRAYSSRFPDLAPSVEITPPAATVPDEDAAFSGLWSGKWGGELPSVLIVQNVSENGSARGLYVWDDSPRGNFEGGQTPFNGRIEDGVLGWGDARIGDYTRFEFEMSGPGSIEGRRIVWDSQKGSVRMQKEM